MRLLTPFRDDDRKPKLLPLLIITLKRRSQHLQRRQIAGPMPGMGGNAGRQIWRVVGIMDEVQPHADAHPIQMRARGGTGFEQYAGDFRTAHQHIIRPFYRYRTVRPNERGNRIGQCQPSHKAQLSGFQRFNAPGQINARHQISFGRLPRPPATAAPGGLGIGQYPVWLHDLLRAQAFGFFVCAVHGFKVNQPIAFGKCDHLMSAGPKSPVSKASGAGISIRAWPALAARSINGEG